MHTTTTRQDLILSLLKLGSERGLAAISLSTLAAENHISKAAIFHHFSNRDELVKALFSYCNTLAYSQRGTINLVGEAEEVLERAMEHWHDLYALIPMRYFYRIIESEALTYPEAGQIKQSLDEMLSAQSLVVLEHLHNQGKLIIDDLDLAVLTFSSVVQRFLNRVLLDEEEDVLWEEERFLASFCRLYQGK
ncbi:MAG: TetR/AcrR family transcriptional regulator [Sphaerochaeta sp.]|jgi:AcrR family transcriptional regulator|uniref:TetR/AcrR family transcriptional regulator n=1 Tax=Sphaerochaeta sp. TaxID=1972642 RepID=UPI002FC98918